MLNASVRRGYSLCAFSLGLLLGGILSALLISVVGAAVRPVVPSPWYWALIAVCSFVLLAHSSGIIDLRLPQSRRLVPITVFRLGAWFGPLQFGIEMGTGLRTYVSSAVPYMLICPLLFLTTPFEAALAGVGFGLGRVAMATASVNSRDPRVWDAIWVASRPRIEVCLASTFLIVLAVTLPGQ